MHDVVLQAKGLDVFYGTSQVLFKMSLSVRKGETLALLGRNGAGKSTTMKLLTGFLAPSSGVARVAGHNMATDRQIGECVDVDGGDAALQQGARDRAAAARMTLLQYADDDAAADSGFMEALRLPKNTNEEREARTVAISAAAVRAAEVPLQTLQVATAIANDAAALTDRSLASAASDLEVARRFARAAGRSAAENVEANLPYIEESETRAQLAQRTIAALADLDRAAPPSA